MEELKQLCSSCNKPTTKICVRCKSSKYCSKECQKEDWPTHKLIYKPYADLLTTRPSPEQFLGIFFAADQLKPQFKWVHCPWKTSPIFGKRHQCADTQALLTPSENTDFRSSASNKKLNRDLSQHITFEFHDNFKVDGSKPNQAILTVAKAVGATFYKFRGPIIAYGCSNGHEDRCPFRDLDTMDFRHIVDWLRFWDGKDEQSKRYIYRDPLTGMNVYDLAPGGRKRFLKATGNWEEDLSDLEISMDTVFKDIYGRSP